MSSRQAWMYGRDLAYIHHVGFGDFTLQASRAIVTMLREAGHAFGSVVDLGCGTGILARTLTEEGFDVLGIDISPSMIALAERHAPHARFRVGSLRDCDLPSCVAVCAIGEGLGYLTPGEERVDLRPLAARAWDALGPGGLFIFDVVEVAVEDPMSYRASRWGPDWKVDIEVTEDVDRSVVTRVIRTTRSDGGRTRSSKEIHRVRTFARTEIERLLVDSGFRVEMAERYGNVPLPPRRVAVVATRPHVDVGT